MMPRLALFLLSLCAVLLGGVGRAAALVPTIRAEAAGPTLRFKRLTTAEGLSENSAYCLLTDRRGFLWVGTQEGLNRYDGTGFRVFRADARASGSLASGFILSLAEDGAGRLWVGTGGGGVARYDPVTEHFQVFRAEPGANKLPSDFVRAVLVDRQGHVWVGTEAGLCRFDPKTGTFRRYPPRANSRETSSLDNRLNAIHSLAQTPDGRVWAGSGAGQLLRVEEATQTLEVAWKPLATEASGAPDVGQRAITVLLPDRNWRLWIGTEGDGLRAFEPANGRLKTFRPTPGIPGGLPAAGVRSLLRDRSGTLWVGTTGGLAQLNTAQETFTSYRHNTGFPATSLPDDAVLALAQDRTGQMWVATESGLASFTNQVGAFARVSGIDADVWAIAPDRTAGHLWVGTESQGALLLAPDGTLTPTPLGSGGLPSPFVRALWPDPATGTVWVGMQSSGLAAYDPATQRIRRFRHDPRDSTSLADDYVRAIGPDRSGQLWVSTEGGLSCLNPATGHGRSFRNRPTDSTSLPSNYVRQAYEDQRKRVWVATGGGGLALLDAARKGRFTTFRHRPADSTSLPSNFVRVIHQDKRGRIWLGTEGGGLACLVDSRPPGRFRIWRAKEGLPANVVYAILEDGGGFLWLSTNRGIARFDPRTGIFRRYDARDGLVRDEFNAGAYARRADGHLYFGGPGGLLAFHPDSLRPNRLVPPVVLTGVRLFDQPLRLPDTAIGARRVLRLRPDQNFLTFEFAALNLRLPDKNRYAYRLRGLDDRWLDIGNRHEAPFTNLSPGTYTFEVKGANNDGVWNEQGATLRILIPPPWYRAWWFRLALVLAFLTLLWAAYRVRVNQLLALEQVRHGIARDLHDDMGSTLSSISILSQIATQHHSHGRAEQVAGLLDQIGESSGRMLDSMDDIVWAINPAHDGLEDVTTRMRIFASDVLEARGIDFTFSVAPEVLLMRLEMRARREFFLLFKEAVNNLAKYARCEHARIALTSSQRHLILTVEDDGVGFDPTAPARGGGNGLTNMRARANALRATLDFQTALGKGTTVSLRVPMGG